MTDRTSIECQRGVVLVAEPHLFGHHFSYLKWIVEGGIHLGVDIIIGTSDEAAGASRFTRWFGGIDDRVGLVTASLNRGKRSSRDGFELLRRENSYYKFFCEVYRKALKNSQLSWVLVPYFDYCIQICALRGSPFQNTNWSTIWMRSAWFHRAGGVRGASSRMRDRFRGTFVKKAMADSKLISVHTIDPLICSRIASIWPNRVAKKLQYLHDPAEIRELMDKKLARRRFRINPDATVVLVFGALSLRKGLDELLGAIDRYDEAGSVVVLLVGEIDPDARDLFSSGRVQRLMATGKIQMCGGFADQAVEQTSFAAADVVWIGYKRHFNMSGVLVQAGQAALPVIASDDGLIGWYTRKYKLGWLVDIGDPASVDRALSSAHDSEKERADFGANGKKVFACHTPEAFSEAIFHEIRHSLSD
jgi:glycosyltransferase involved in cell wall biosynthesis